MHASDLSSLPQFKGNDPVLFEEHMKASSATTQMQRTKDAFESFYLNIGTNPDTSGLRRILTHRHDHAASDGTSRKEFLPASSGSLSDFGLHVSNSNGKSESTTITVVADDLIDVRRDMKEQGSLKGAREAFASKFSEFLNADPSDAMALLSLAGELQALYMDYTHPDLDFPKESFAKSILSKAFAHPALKGAHLVVMLDAFALDYIRGQVDHSFFREDNDGFNASLSTVKRIFPDTSFTATVPQDLPDAAEAKKADQKHSLPKKYAKPITAYLKQILRTLKDPALSAEDKSVLQTYFSFIFKNLKDDQMIKGLNSKQNLFVIFLFKFVCQPLVAMKINGESARESVYFVKALKLLLTDMQDGKFATKEIGELVGEITTTLAGICNIK